MLIERFFASLGLEVDKRKIGETKRAITDVHAGVSRLKTLALGALGGLGAAALVRSLRNVSKEADVIAKRSKAFGLAAQDFQAFAFAAERSGVSVDGLGIAMKGLQKRLGQAMAGGSEARKVFEELGLSYQALASKSTADQFRSVVARLGEMDNQATKANAAMRLFEESGAQLIPLFNEGADGLARLESQFQALGGGFSDESLQRAEEMEDLFTNIGTIFTSLKTHALLALHPLRSFVSNIIESEGFIVRVGRALRVVGIAFGTVASIAAASWAIAFGPALLLGAAATVVVLGVAAAIEDMVAAINGERSVFNHFLKWLTDIKDEGHEFNGIASTMNGWFGGIGETIASMLDPTTSLVEKIKELIELMSDLLGITDAGKALGEAFSGMLGDDQKEGISNFVRDLSSNVEAAGPIDSIGGLGRNIMAATGVVEFPRPNNSTMNTTNRSTTNNVKIEVSGAQDPKMVAEEIQRKWESEVGAAAEAFVPRVSQ